MAAGTTARRNLMGGHRTPPRFVTPLSLFRSDLAQEERPYVGLLVDPGVEGRAHTVTRVVARSQDDRRLRGRRGWEARDHLPGVVRVHARVVRAGHEEDRGVSRSVLHAV